MLQNPPETIKLNGPNPFDEEDPSGTELASVAYRCVYVCVDNMYSVCMCMLCVQYVMQGSSVKL